MLNYGIIWCMSRADLKQWSFYTRPDYQIHKDLLVLKQQRGYERLSESEFLKTLIEYALNQVLNCDN